MLQAIVLNKKGLMMTCRLNKYHCGIFLILFSVFLLLSLLHPPTAVAAIDRPDELADRLEVLRAEIVEKGYAHAVGYSPASDRSINELCGLRPPPSWEKLAPWDDKSLSFRLLDAGELPERLDWREQLATPPVRDQGNCGSCWAFSTVGPMEFEIARKEAFAENLSEQYLVSCNPWGYGCDGGWFAHGMHLAPGGAVFEIDFPYVARDIECDGPYDQPYQLESWRYIGTSWAIPSPDQIKQAIYDHGPVAAAVCVGSQFHYYKGGVFNVDASCGDYVVNHGIVLVGWDDTVNCGGGKYGAWILRNSWGPGWGEDGYMTICYDVSEVGYAANYVVYTENPEYSFNLSIQKTGSGSGNVLSDPPGINCGEDCSEEYTDGSAVKLNQAADSQSLFLGWDGGGCSGLGTCEIQITEDTFVTAIFTTEDLFNLITRYYTSILDRLPEPGGAESWAREAERLSSLGLEMNDVLFSMSKAFFNSNEYLMQGKSDGAYLTDLYQTFLGRDPDSAGYDSWIAELQEGLSRNALLYNFFLSEEFGIYLGGILGVHESRPERKLVNDLYRGFLGRFPDNAGFLSWVDLMTQAQCAGEEYVKNLSCEIARSFVHSAEYALRERDNDGFVEDLYDGIMRRTPDALGFIAWAQLLDTGAMGREEVLSAFINSPEFQLRVNEVVNAGCLSSVIQQGE